MADCRVWATNHCTSQPRVRRVASIACNSRLSSGCHHPAAAVYIIALIWKYKSHPAGYISLLDRTGELENSINYYLLGLSDGTCMGSNYKWLHLVNVQDIKAINICMAIIFIALVLLLCWATDTNRQYLLMHCLNFDIIILSYRPTQISWSLKIKEGESVSVPMTQTKWFVYKWRFHCNDWYFRSDKDKFVFLMFFWFPYFLLGLHSSLDSNTASFCRFSHWWLSNSI